MINDIIVDPTYLLDEGTSLVDIENDDVDTCSECESILEMASHFYCDDCNESKHLACLGILSKTSDKDLEDFSCCV